MKYPVYGLLPKLDTKLLSDLHNVLRTGQCEKTNTGFSGELNFAISIRCLSHLFTELGIRFPLLLWLPGILVRPDAMAPLVAP
jgi:hypothetical protein